MIMTATNYKSRTPCGEGLEVSKPSLFPCKLMAHGPIHDQLAPRQEQHGEKAWVEEGCSHWGDEEVEIEKRSQGGGRYVFARSRAQSPASTWDPSLKGKSIQLPPTKLCLWVHEPLGGHVRSKPECHIIFTNINWTMNVNVCDIFKAFQIMFDKLTIGIHSSFHIPHLYL